MLRDIVLKDDQILRKWIVEGGNLYKLLYHNKKDPPKMEGQVEDSGSISLYYTFSTFDEGLLQES